MIGHFRQFGGCSHSHTMLPLDKYEKTMRSLIKEYRQHFFTQRYINHLDIANDYYQEWKIDDISEGEIRAIKKWI